MQIPVLLPGRGLIITLPYVVPEKAEELKYSIDIYSLNGNVRQIVRYLLIGGTKGGTTQKFFRKEEIGRFPYKRAPDGGARFKTPGG